MPARLLAMPLCAVLVGCGGPAGEVVFVAASAAEVVEQALGDCPGRPPGVVGGSSATLARQLEQGAPAGLFLSANPQWMDHLEEAGRVVPGSRRDLLTNRLVLVGPAGAPPQDLAQALAGLGDDRLAVGDPDHVPAGIYAREGLESLGLWAALEPRLARAADVRAALALVERGEAPLGLVYATDAAASAAVAVVAALPVESHAPVRYPLALVGSPGEGAQAAWSCLQGPEARARFAARGFGTP